MDLNIYIYIFFVQSVVFFIDIVYCWMFIANSWNLLFTEHS